MTHAETGVFMFASSSYSATVLVHGVSIAFFRLASDATSAAHSLASLWDDATRRLDYVQCGKASLPRSARATTAAAQSMGSNFAPYHEIQEFRKTSLTYCSSTGYAFRNR